MKRFIILVIVTILLTSIATAQDYNITISGNTITASGSVNGIGGSATSNTISSSDIMGGNSGSYSNSGPSSGNSGNSGSSGRDSDRGSSSSSSENTYSGPDFMGEWGWNGSISTELYEKMEGMVGLEKDNAEAMSVLSEMKDLLSADYIDFKQLNSIQTRVNSLSSFQISALGHEGKETIAQFEKKLNEAKMVFNQYLIMAQRIRNNSFSDIDKEVMQLTYEEQNGYLRQFLSKEEYNRAKIEYEKYERVQIVNNVHEKIRIQELRKKNDNKKAEKTNYHLTLQKVRRSWIDNYKVGAMAVKSISDGQKQLTNTYGEKVIPKVELIEEFDEGINTINKAKDIKGLFVKVFSGDWEGTYSDGKRIMKEMVFNPTKDMLSGSVTVLTNKWINLKNGIAAYNIHSFSTEGILNKSLLNVESFGDDTKFYNANKDLNNFLFKSIPEKTRDEIKKTY